MQSRTRIFFDAIADKGMVPHMAGQVSSQRCVHVLLMWIRRVLLKPAERSQFVHRDVVSIFKDGGVLLQK